MSLLEQDITRKGQIDEYVTKWDVGNNNSNEYKVEVIYNSAIYAKGSKLGYLPRFYYLIFWKNYLKEKNT